MAHSASRWRFMSLFTVQPSCPQPVSAIILRGPIWLPHCQVSMSHADAPNFSGKRGSVSSQKHFLNQCGKLFQKTLKIPLESQWPYITGLCLDRSLHEKCLAGSLPLTVLGMGSFIWGTWLHGRVWKTEQDGVCWQGGRGSMVDCIPFSGCNVLDGLWGPC